MNARSKYSSYNNKKAQLAQAYQSLTIDLTSPVLRTIGNYTLGKTLGSGSYGVVRLSTHRLVKGARVAVKSVSKTHSQLSALVRELHHYRRLSHPHIAKLLEIVATERDIHLVSELCDGGELYDYLVDRGRLSDLEAKRVFGQLMLALNYLHSNNVVHRDLKLENILLDKDGNVKLGDFGFAREFDDGPGNLMDTWCGTTAYASPEMLRGEKYSGEETDIWSAGIILYALLTGGLPFDDDDDDVMRDLILKGEYYNPIGVISSDACDLISKILQLDPSNRPSIEEILSHPWFTRFPSQDPQINPNEKIDVINQDNYRENFYEKQVDDIPQFNNDETEFDSDFNPDDEPPRRIVPSSKSFESLTSINNSMNNNNNNYNKRKSTGSYNRTNNIARTLSGGSIVNAANYKSGSNTPPIHRTPSRTKRRSISSTMSDLPSITPVASRIPSTTSLREYFKMTSDSIEHINIDNSNNNNNTNNNNEILYPQEPNYIDMLKVPLPQPFENEWERNLLQSLGEVGFDTGQIKHSVINHACDAAAGLWWLIRKQNIDKREHLTKIEEEATAVNLAEKINNDRINEKIERNKRKDERDNKYDFDYLMMKDTKSKKNLNEKQRVISKKKSLPDISEPNVSPSVAVATNSSTTLIPTMAPSVNHQSEASVSSLQLPNNNEKSKNDSKSYSPSKSKSRSASISMLQRATTALGGSMLARKKSDDRSFSDEQLTTPPKISSNLNDHNDDNTKNNDSSKASSTVTLPTFDETVSNNNKNLLMPSPQKTSKQQREVRQKGSIFNTVRTWFTEDKKKVKSGNISNKTRNNTKDNEGYINLNDNTNNTNTNTNNNQTNNKMDSITRSNSYKFRQKPQQMVSRPPYRRTESNGSNTSIKSPIKMNRSRRSSSIHSRRSSVSIQFEGSPSGSLTTPMSRRWSSGSTRNSYPISSPGMLSSNNNNNRKPQHSKSPSMSSVGSNKSFKVNRRHRRNSSTSLQKVRHIRAPSSPLPRSNSQSQKHSRATSLASNTSSNVDDEKVSGLGLKDDSSKANTINEHMIPRTLFLASKRITMVRPPPINLNKSNKCRVGGGVRSPSLKPLTASKFDYSRASPTKFTTMTNNDNNGDNDNLMKSEESGWMDEDEYAGGIGQGEYSHSIGEYEMDYIKNIVDQADIDDDDDTNKEDDTSDNDKIEGVKKLKKKSSKQKQKQQQKQDDVTAKQDFNGSSTSIHEFKFPQSGNNGNGNNNNSTGHQKWRPSVTTAAVIEEDEEDD